jgi:hypothetical protein
MKRAVSTKFDIYAFITGVSLVGTKIQIKYKLVETVLNKGNNKITELRTILQRESQNS